MKNQFILQSQLHGLACSTRVSSRGAVAKVSLGRVVRLLLDRSTCLQEEKHNNIKIEMKRGEAEHRGRIKVRGREVKMKEWE